MAYLRLKGKYWYICYYDKEKEKNNSFTTKKTIKNQALKDLKIFEARKLLDPVSTLINPQNALYSFDNAFTKFINHKKYSAKTISYYHSCASNFVKALGNRPLIMYTKIDNLTLHDYLINKKNNNYKRKDSPVISQNSASTMMNGIIAIWTFFKKYELINKIPFDKIKSIKMPVNVFSPAELQLFFEWFYKQPNKIYYLLYRLTYLCAYRISEALNANGDDFDVMKKLVTIKNIKAKRIDVIPMPNDLESFILDYQLNKKNKLFTHKSPDSLKNVWKRMKRETGLDYSIHDLRRTRATDLANKGVPPLYLHTFLRHKDFKTTQEYYLKVSLKSAKEAIDKAIIGTDMAQKSTA